MSELNLIPYIEGQRDRRKPRVASGKSGRFVSFQADILKVMGKLEPQMQFKRWREVTRETFKGAPELEGVEDDFWDLLKRQTLIPDAFVVSREEMFLHFFEVEVTNPMSADKLRSYAVFVTLMDFYGIAFEVYAVNQHMHINRVDLAPHYVRWLKEQTA